MMNKKLLLLSASVLVMAANNQAFAIDLNDLPSNAHVSWAAVNNSGVDTVKIGDKYFQYSYTQPTNYNLVTPEMTVPTGNIENLLFKDRGTFLRNVADNHRNIIKADFVKNYSSYGAAIYNEGVIDNLQGNFINNHVVTTNEESDSVNPQIKKDAFGGAIYNDNVANQTTIDKIQSSDFINNYVDSKYGFAYGGAIYNAEGATINSIEGNFIGNFATAEKLEASGGAIWSSKAKIESIKGKFIGNYAKSENDKTGGGAIITSVGTLSDSVFLNNYASAKGTAMGGAALLVNADQINNVQFKDNYVYSENGYDQVTADEESLSGGGALWIGSGTINDSKFENNHADSKIGKVSGGAIYSSAQLTVSNTSFTGNSASSESGTAKGGAIYSLADLNIKADNGKTSEFTGNFVKNGSETTSNSVYMESGDLTLTASDNGKIIFNDGIDGWDGKYNLNMNGNKAGNIYFNNNISNADIWLTETNATLGNVSYLADKNNTLTIQNAGTFNLSYLGVGDIIQADLISIENGGLFNIKTAEADLANRTMGKFQNGIVSVENGGKINVESFVLTSDSEETQTSVLFAENGYKDKVGTSATEAGKGVQNAETKAYAPIYMYHVTYDAESGSFVFTRADSVIPTTPIKPITPSYKAFNPGIFAGSVAELAALNTQENIVKQVFDNSKDYDFDYNRGRVWALPYYSDDTISYDNFYDVDSRNYGLIAGVDSRTFGTSYGPKAIYTVFGAYNDGKDDYANVNVKTKSWLAGLKASVYYGGFYGDALVNYAHHDSDLKTMHGKESVNFNGYGAALKVGYKFGTPCNRWKTDLSALLDWQNTEGKDRTTKQGLKIKMDDYSRLTLTPQLKVGYRALKYWTPYALARYNFVLSEDGSTSANAISLPEIESKDYVEYGVGVETANTGSHSGFAQILRHNGGREGWSGTLGYRYSF